MLDLGEIQGNVLAGFNTRVEAFIGLTARPDADLVAAAKWLGGLAPRLSTVEDVRRSRQLMKAPFTAISAIPPWLAVAVGPRMIAAALPDVRIDDRFFATGMAQTRSAIGDETAPAEWVVCRVAEPVDALLLVASNVESAVLADADALISAAAVAGFDCTYRETGMRLPGEVEHFGFRDGISQPDVAGDRSSTGLQPGHFVFGYPAIEGGPPIVNQLDPAGFSLNGSLLVFRRLVQDVAAFRAFFAAEAARLSPHWCGLSETWLAALVVGRWPSGAPASTRVSADPGANSDDNSFDFSDDLDGLRCPFAAHIRKVNPRKGIRDEVDVPRILRRGIPFGPAFPIPSSRGRGLLFISYQTSIKDKFVFLSGTWMNQPNRPQVGGGHDLLVGRSRTGRSMTIAGPNGAVTISAPAQHWIIPTGGAYLFAPSRHGLSMLARPAAPI